MNYRTMHTFGLALLAAAYAASSLAAPEDLPLPDRLRACGELCFVFTRNGDHYDNRYESAADQKVISRCVFKRFTREEVVVECSDSRNVATLRGRMSSTSEVLIDGRVSWRNPPEAGSSQPMELSWGSAIAEAKSWSERAKINAQPLIVGELPEAMRMCSYACFLLKRDGNRYLFKWEGKTDDKIEVVYRAKRFTRESIVMEQVDGERVLTGRVSADGNSLVDGQIKWPGGAVLIELSWGSALASAHVPAPNAAGAAKFARPKFTDDEQLALREVVQLPNAQAQLACNARASISTAEALEIGKAALRAFDLERGVCWLNRAGAQGSSRAKVLLALAMEHGWGPLTPDPAEARDEYERIARESNDAWAKFFLRQRISKEQGPRASLEGLLAIDNEILHSPDGDALRPFIEADWRTRCQYDRTMDTLFTSPPQSTEDCRYVDGGRRQICTHRAAPPPKPYRPSNPTLAAVCPDLR